MSISQMYIAIAILALLVIALLVLFAGKQRKEKNLTPLADLAFAFVLAGMFFGENRWIGYSLMGIGVLLAVVDIFSNRSKTI